MWNTPFGSIKKASFSLSEETKDFCVCIILNRTLYWSAVCLPLILFSFPCLLYFDKAWKILVFLTLWLSIGSYLCLTGGLYLWFRYFMKKAVEETGYEIEKITFSFI
jgi:hypothetical protein